MLYFIIIPTIQNVHIGSVTLGYFMESSMQTSWTASDQIYLIHKDVSIYKILRQIFIFQYLHQLIVIFITMRIQNSV